VVIATIATVIALSSLSTAGKYWCSCGGLRRSVAQRRQTCGHLSEVLRREQQTTCSSVLHRKFGDSRHQTVAMAMCLAHVIALHMPFPLYSLFLSFGPDSSPITIDQKFNVRVLQLHRTSLAASHLRQAAVPISTRSPCGSSISRKRSSGCNAIRFCSHPTNACTQASCGLCIRHALPLEHRPSHRVCYSFAQIAADSIEISRREKVVGYEMSLMSQDELMELLGMTKVSMLDHFYLPACPTFLRWYWVHLVTTRTLG